MGQVFAFGLAPNLVAQEQNILDFVFNSACISRPITVSKLILFTPFL
jgi:hypothetical protein